MYKLRADGTPERIAALAPDSGPNGLAVEPDGRTLYGADSLKGIIWSIPVAGGSVTPWLTDAALAPVPTEALPIGANGLRFHKGALWVNNTFYAYFASKDELVATAGADQMRAQHENMVAQAAPGRAGLEQIVRWYFSPEQRDNIEDGCPNAALLDEIARSTDPTLQAYTRGRRSGWKA
ncbi:hypothetical protein ACIBW9_37115 [Streptomyces sp. NPDC049541]|uniref:hypothetical protein n=1 Tax=Streptomyces sp. NPDC049541 TaxID=3365594 RepID=UPI0037954BAA